ncbi:pilus assembly protein N-terminal domain-containing protein [Vibrio mediterranei]|uniref:type II and III secretion system protein family protein n=1 Tax=Vibrio mediterranei TaxID=689 RepID=UPI001EFDF5BA|nr:pilus assembly protein N-terminal domain-containing protein [Vibrio mediterranei]MCG9629070.1 pilus assembly protein N-terminal domain-containing protein [Vibrio mediterranei]
MRKYAVVLIFILFPMWSALASDSLLLDVGEAKTISLHERIKKAYVSNPDVMDYNVINSKKIIILGKSNGTSAFVAYDVKGNEINNITVNVKPNVHELSQKLKLVYPNEQIHLKSIANALVVMGIISSSQIRTEIINFLAKALQKKKTKSGSYEGIVDNTRINKANQVNVKLTIAEVSSDFLSELGINYGQRNNTGGTTLLSSGITQTLLDFSATDLVAVINAQKNNSLGQILAEPNLSVISGKTADFHAGGKVPIITYDQNQRKIEYMDYGVKLHLKADVMRNHDIQLELNPEVSSLDLINGDQEVGIPALKTRSANTTVELKNGQSFVLGGLLSSDDKQAVSKVPFLGDIPILGAFFSSTSTEAKKTELIIIATVNFTSAIDSKQVVLPRMKKTSELSRLFNIDLSNDDDSDLEVFGGVK